MSKSKKKLAAFRLEDEIRSMADQNILIRASFRKNRRPENFSTYLRNLIIEDYRYNKNLLESKKDL